MKKYTLLIMITTFFPACSMEENWMTQSTILQPGQPQPSDKIKELSFMRKAMNKDFTQKTTDYKDKVRERIEALKSAHIIEDKEYQYNEDSKLDIMNQFFTTYPNQICPELRLIIKNINNSFNRKDLITILPKLKTQMHSSKNDLIANVIELTETKKFNFNDTEIQLMNNCLKIICSNQIEDYQQTIEETTKVIQLENAKTKAKIAAKKIRTNPENTTTKDLEKYKQDLEKLIIHLEEQKTSQDIINKYQETISHIDLCIKIDEQLLIDYSDFSINELFDYLEVLGNLRKQLQDTNSKRYKKLNQRVKNANIDLQFKRQQRDSKERMEKRKRLEQERLEEENLRKQMEQKKLEQRLKEEEEKEEERKIQQTIKLEEEKREQTRLEYENKLKQQRLEQEQLAEQQRLEQQRLRENEEQRRERKARSEYEKLESQQLEQQRLEKEAREKALNTFLSQRTRQFTAIREMVSNFLNYLRSWWPF
jgi:hypothetical protein